MATPRHPNAHIEKAVRYAVQLGWTVKLSKGHPWGRIYCPEKSRDGCIVTVASTPRNPENHARHFAEKSIFAHIAARTSQQRTNHGQENVDQLVRATVRLRAGSI